MVPILIAFEFRCVLFDCLTDSEAGLAVLDGGGTGYKEGVELESHQQDRQPGAEQVKQVPPLHSHQEGIPTASITIVLVCGNISLSKE